MYWTLTGYIGGFISAFFLHSLAAGTFSPVYLWALPPLALFIVYCAADIETSFLYRWKQQIARRRAAGVLTRRFCLILGATTGAVIYPIIVLLWRTFLDNEARKHSIVGIALMVVSLSVSLFLAWYLLTRFPKANEAT